jgi:pyruvate dehydrogenase E1 component
MYEAGDDVMYYITLYNENYPMPPIPPGDEVVAGILKGMYKYRPSPIPVKGTKVQLLGSGTLLNEALRAQHLLAEKFGIAADAWSVTSYKELRRDALDAERWNLLHPTAEVRKSYLEQLLAKESGVFVAVSDYMRQVPEMIQRWVPGGLYVLGADGFGRSDTRGALRRFFEVDAESIVLAALSQLARRGHYKPAQVQKAMQELGIDPEKPNPMRA